MKFFVLIGLLISLSAFPAEPPSRELVVYTYDSILSKGGVGSSIFPLFEKKQGCRVRAIAHGDGGQILSRIELDVRRGKPGAHLVLGIDQPIWERMKPLTEVWGKWVPKGYSHLKSEILLEKGFLPYDYGALALMADQKALQELKVSQPASLSELLQSKWKRNLILEDPRTSTPGLMFLLFTQKVLGTESWSFWKNFKGQWLTFAPGWDSAYQLFLRKEAPLVWSYVTSQAYHEENGDQAHRYQAVLFKEGQPLQIEGAAVIKGAFQSPQTRKNIEAFMEFLISDEVQKQIPLRTWMYPAKKGTELPESYKKLPQPKMIPMNFKVSEIEAALAQWSRVVGS